MPPAAATPGCCRRLGWQVAALEYGADGAEVAAERGLAVLRADADGAARSRTSLDLVVAFDVLEHILDDDAAVAEVGRMLRPGGPVPGRRARPTRGCGRTTTSRSATSAATPATTLCDRAGAGRLRGRVA